MKETTKDEKIKSILHTLQRRAWINCYNYGETRNDIERTEIDKSSSYDIDQALSQLKEIYELKIKREKFLPNEKEILEIMRPFLWGKSGNLIASGLFDKDIAKALSKRKTSDGKVTK